ncbi:exo-rhamnogalacturonan lyase family protein [Bacillus sp. FSL K6-3431]|uniref:exo-rhamnogalacturonan lyase family protein n=1 Tax=Bacillus sp. FSL K6-3431 TaxID=2921500 RepID=UPI0030FA81BB
MKVKWLKIKPKYNSGVTWGVPWKRGILNKEQSLTLRNKSGMSLPLQSWPMAYWPDGTVKWTGHAAVLQGKDDSFEIETGKSSMPDQVKIMETTETLEITNGLLEIVINKQGQHIIEAIKTYSKLIAHKGKLLAIHEERSQVDGVKVKTEETLECRIKHVNVEQSGPIRCVIKLAGTHYSRKQSKDIFPFTLRLYIYAGSTEMKIVHTFYYDGQPEENFIKGLGIDFSIPLEGESWNRHVRVAGEKGIYGEPGQLLLTRKHRNANGLYEKQIKGEIIDLSHSENKELLAHVKQNAIWNDFKISQDSANHFRFCKRTNDRNGYIDAFHGERANGLAYVGGTAGGMAIGLKDFWQKHPTALEVNALNEQTTKLRAWFWSSDVEAMDLRHYSEDTHVTSAYEGFDEMRATPYGIANTSEVFIQSYLEPPTNNELMNQAQEWQAPRLLVCEPEYYYDTKTLGIWSLPDTTNQLKAKIETQLNDVLEFYQNEIEQRNWYGFWHYGDVMHTYDSIRHQWRYDLGGFAWQNTELVPNIWLWHTFLRTGREDVFRMAEAMTRHTSEVDCYHFGEYAGLGSRHNVMHWGCGCKEVRISMAGLHKFYYYLTADERTGERLTAVRDAEQSLITLDPMRAYYPDDDYETHARVGPDWAALCSNWTTEWERTENPIYKDRIMKSIDQLKSLPMKLLSGPTFGYDPRTNDLYPMGDGLNAYHMVIAFGAPQAWIEIAELIDDHEWEEMLSEFGEFYMLSNEDKLRRSNGQINDQNFNLPMLAAGIIAYAANKKTDANLAEKAWGLLLNNHQSQFSFPFKIETITAWAKLDEVTNVTTNTSSQWCLNAMMALELIGDYLTDDVFRKSMKVQ